MKGKNVFTSLCVQGSKEGKKRRLERKNISEQPSAVAGRRGSKLTVVAFGPTEAGNGFKTTMCSCGLIGCSICNKGNAKRTLNLGMK